MDNSAPSMLKPTLIGGLTCGIAAGLLSGVPLLGCACCALIIGAGFLAAYLYSNECKKVGAGFRPGNGAIVGLISGLFYAVGHTAGGALYGGPDADEIDQVVEQMEQGGAPPEFVDAMLQVFDLLQGPMGIVIVFFTVLLVAAVFSTIGGLIGGAVFKVEPAVSGPTAGGAEGGGPPGP